MSEAKDISWLVPVMACIIWLFVLYLISPDRSLERAVCGLAWVIFGGLLVATITALVCEVNQ
jgi:hypothetical protein